MGNQQKGGKMMCWST